MDSAEPHPIIPYQTLILVLAALLVLTGVTIGVSYLDLGVFNVPITLAIASAKASLVLLYFMHLKYEGIAIKASFIGTICFLAIMISFTFWDIAFRH